VGKNYKNYRYYKIMTNKIDFLLDKYPPGQEKALKKKLDKLNKKKLNKIELKSWYEVRGTMEFQEENNELAEDIFLRGLDLFPESPTLHFNVGSAIERLGKIDSAMDHFKFITLANTSSAVVLYIARICYLWDYPKEGENFMQSIFERYYDLGNIDDHYLYMRGLPFYGDSFGYLATFAKMENKNEVIIEELVNAKEKLRDYNFDNLELIANAFITDNWAIVLSSLNKSLAKEDDAYPYGFQYTKKAVIESRNSTDYTNGIEILESVELTEIDFSWLYDILTLVKSELSNKFERFDDETEFLRLFWKNQPKLFEPNHLFSFGLFQYQEKLKKEYQSRIVNK
jgi:hypothetical protein